MFDARYFAYATISALLVISPGATMAVVMETVMGEGRLAGLLTVLGINIGNSTLALSSAFGMSVVFHTWPSTLQAVKIAGALYLAYLGARGIWFAWRRRSVASAPASRLPAGHTSTEAAGSARRDVAHTTRQRISVSACLSRGIITNLLNPPVVLFYMTFLPQFIGPHDPFFARFLVLAGTHVGMSLAWLACYAFALGVLADRFARPSVRRTLEGLTGVVLLGFAVRMLTR